MQTTSESSIEVKFRSLHSNFEKDLTFLTVPRITDMTPDEPFPRELVEIPANLRLSDPQFHTPRPVDMLVGSGATLSLLSVGQINLSRNGCDLYLQKMQLGWVEVGGINDANNFTAACNLTELRNLMEWFWAIDDISNGPNEATAAEACESHYKKTTIQNADGRYVVRLFFHNG
ncbi:uncharacterized protein LOC103318179 [Nasonia vitripennis]|uniref:Uncharacterized protein n=1 Tax=Nasonia vitripennis TaxID=7425 RepID=A0A7M7HDG6_NASVI|nr:uncharacterized protein LOC103318179 [Nasonia vitripennis]